MVQHQLDMEVVLQIQGMLDMVMLVLQDIREL